MNDLVVAYRIYPGVSRVPAFFPTDKFRLSEMCLSSFHRALGGLRVRIWALLDGCPPEYETLFRETLQGCELEILSLDKIGNMGTFAHQIDLLMNQTDAEYVYFAEDDYYYFPDAVEKMVAFMRGNADADFVTPYDHPDSYNMSSRYERHLVRPWGDRYWRTASSTCLTFLTSRQVLRETASAFRSYSSGNMDCSMWLSLTEKGRLFNPRIHLSDSFRAKIWAKTWIWGARRVVLGRRYRLWAPLPTLSTHMESTGLSPLVDWQEEFVKFQEHSSRNIE